MRKFLICFAALTSLAITTVQPLSADDFFSSDSLKSVFQPKAPTTPQQPPQQPPQSPSVQPPAAPAPKSTAIEPAEIPALLTMMGYQPKDLGNNIYNVDIKQGEWTLPFMFLISPDKSQLWISISLNTLKPGVTIPQEKLMGMLKVSHKYGPFHFTYSEKLRRIYLSRAMANRALTIELIKRQITFASEIATETEDLWNDDKWQTTPAAPTAPQQTAPAPQVGTWRSTAADGSKFQLTLNADGTFVLYHTTTTKQDKSVGRYTLVGNELTLMLSETDKLESFITWNADGTFRFDVKNAQPGAQGLLFARI